MCDNKVVSEAACKGMIEFIIPDLKECAYEHPNGALLCLLYIKHVSKNDLVSSCCEQTEIDCLSEFIRASVKISHQDR